MSLAIVLTFKVIFISNLAPKTQIKLNTKVSNCKVNSSVTGTKLVHHRRHKCHKLTPHCSLRQRRHLFQRNSVVQRFVTFYNFLVTSFRHISLQFQIAITLSLASQKNSQTLHFTAARMTLVSSMLNFFVYGGMLKQYRSAYKIVLKKLCGCGESMNRIRPEGGRGHFVSKKNMRKEEHMIYSKKVSFCPMCYFECPQQHMVRSKGLF